MWDFIYEEMFAAIPDGRATRPTKIDYNTRAKKYAETLLWEIHLLLLPSPPLPSYKCLSYLGERGRKHNKMNLAAQPQFHNTVLSTDVI